MAHRLPAAFLVILCTACSASRMPASSDRSATAQSFFRAVYGCAPDGLAAMSNPDVALSYPIFETLYNTSVIRGQEAVTEFSRSFCRRWADPSISIDEVIDDGDRVVLIWSFSATDRLAQEPSRARQSWGGISVFDFDEAGLVLEEFGEESSPGPAARLAPLGGS